MLVSNGLDRPRADDTIHGHYHHPKMAIKHLTYLLAFACFSGVALCFVIGGLGRQWPKAGIRSIYAFKRAEFTPLGWRLRNAAVAFSYLGCAFGITSYFS